MRGKTIQIYLPEGNPRGIKIAEITTSIGKAVVIPRSKLNDVSDRQELQGVGVYFLFGEKDELGNPETYIGEAETLIKRLKQHHSSKDFWNLAVVFISEKNNLNKAHVKFLENHCCQKAKSANRCTLQNSNTPTRSTITESEEDFVLTFFDDLKILLGTLGYPIFEEVKTHKKMNLYFCSTKGIEAKGEYVDEGFLVLKGSQMNPNETKSVQGWISNTREKLFTSGSVAAVDGVLVFQSDQVFTSPSAAAAVVLGRSANGWTEWKRQDGKSLDEVERKNQ